MKYICANCWYNYDESAWDEVEEIESWTKVEDLICCPVCFEVDNFIQIKEEVIYISEDSIDKIEREHFIEINHKNRTIEVTIWNNSHPMEQEHRLLSVWLFDEYGDLVEEKFLKEDDDTVTTFDDYDLDDIEIRVRCNKHWIFWRKFELNS